MDVSSYWSSLFCVVRVTAVLKQQDTNVCTYLFLLSAFVDYQHDSYDRLPFSSTLSIE